MLLLKFLLANQQCPLGTVKLSPTPKKTAGFTLIELLVGMIIAVLVITPVLGFMLNILQTDRREQAKVNTEQEIQAAADFIARDLQQSVFIYDAPGIYGPGGNDGIKNELANITNVPNGEPVLVFWKRTFLVDELSQDFTALCTDATKATCNDAFVYSLVAYYLVSDGTTASIERFELEGGIGEDDDDNDIQDIKPQETGFQFNLDTLAGESLEEKLNNWERSTVSTGTDPTSDVLINNIDHSTAGVPSEACPDDPSTPALEWEQVPRHTGTGAVGTNFQTFSFYTCIYSPEGQPDERIAKVFLRGNALARINSSDNDYTTKRENLFPRAAIQVQGTGQLGQGSQ